MRCQEVRVNSEKTPEIDLACADHKGQRQKRQLRFNRKRRSTAALQNASDEHKVSTHGSVLECTTCSGPFLIAKHTEHVFMVRHALPSPIVVR